MTIENFKIGDFVKNRAGVIAWVEVRTVKDRIGIKYSDGRIVHLEPNELTMVDPLYICHMDISMKSDEFATACKIRKGNMVIRTAVVHENVNCPKCLHELGIIHKNKIWFCGTIADNLVVPMRKPTDEELIEELKLRGVKVNINIIEILGR